MNVVIVLRCWLNEPFDTSLGVLHCRQANGGICRTVQGVAIASFGQFKEKAPGRERPGIKVQELPAARIAVIENLQTLQVATSTASPKRASRSS
jgi:hypothetical protein